MSHKKQHLITSTADHDVTGLTALEFLRVNAGGTAIESAVPASGGPSFGLDNEVPYTNAGGTDYDYISDFTFDGSKLTVIGETLLKHPASGSVNPLEVQTSAGVAVLRVSNGSVLVGPGTIDASVNHQVRGTNGTTGTSQFSVVHDTSAVIGEFRAGSNSSGVWSAVHGIKLSASFAGFFEGAVRVEAGNLSVGLAGFASARLHVKGAGTGAGVAFLVEDSLGVDRLAVTDGGDMDLKTGVYKSGGVSGVSFGPSAVTSITVTNGIVTAIS